MIAFLWGLAEATLFFIVPDVWLTRMALKHSLASALGAALAAAVGALLGGAAMVAWSVADAPTLHQLLETLPAVSAEMVSEVQRQVQAGDALTLLGGSFSGIPYKLYAAYVAQGTWSLWLFFLLTIPLRLVRFVAVVLVAFAARRVLSGYCGEKCLLRLWAAFWITFYILFWSLMPG